MGLTSPLIETQRVRFDPATAHGGPCGVAGCAHPSCYVERDIRQTNEPGDVWVKFENVGPMRFFCAEHAPTSRRPRRNNG